MTTKHHSKKCWWWATHTQFSHNKCFFVVALNLKTRWERHCLSIGSYRLWGRMRWEGRSVSSEPPRRLLRHLTPSPPGGQRDWPRGCCRCRCRRRCCRCCCRWPSSGWGCLFSETAEWKRGLVYLCFRWTNSHFQRRSKAKHASVPGCRRLVLKLVKSRMRHVTLKTGKCEGVKKFKFAGSTGLATVTVVPKLLIKSSVPERVRLVFGSKTSKGSWSEDPPCWAAAC